MQIKVGTCEALRFYSNSNRPSDRFDSKVTADSKIFESNRPCICLLLCSS